MTITAILWPVRLTPQHIVTTQIWTNSATQMSPGVCHCFYFFQFCDQEPKKRWFYQCCLINMCLLLTLSSPHTIFSINQYAFQYGLILRVPFCLSFTIDHIEAISHFFRRRVGLYDEFNTIAFTLSSISCAWQRPISVPEQKGSEKQKRTARAQVSRSLKRVRGTGNRAMRCGHWSQEISLSSMARALSTFQMLVAWMETEVDIYTV